MREMWFRIDSIQAGKGTDPWTSPDLIKLALTEPVIEVIERAIAGSSDESNPVARSMGAAVETELQLPDDCVECLKMEASGAPEVQYVRCEERIVRPAVLASAKGVAVRVYGSDHEVLLLSERIRLEHFHARVRAARSRELSEAMEQAMAADAPRATAPKRDGLGVL